MLMGATLTRRIGEQSASKLVRSVKPGCIIDCVGRPAADSPEGPSRGAGGAADVAEFVAVSVVVVLVGALGRRSGGGVPLELLSDLSNPLVEISAAVVASGRAGAKGFAARPVRAPGKGKERFEVYESPLADEDIVLVRPPCRCCRGHSHDSMRSCGFSR